MRFFVQPLTNHFLGITRNCMEYINCVEYSIWTIQDCLDQQYEEDNSQKIIGFMVASYIKYDDKSQVRMQIAKYIKSRLKLKIGPETQKKYEGLQFIFLNEFMGCDDDRSLFKVIEKVHKKLYSDDSMAISLIRSLADNIY